MAGVSGFPPSLEREKRARLRERLATYQRERKGEDRNCCVPLVSFYHPFLPLSLRSKRMRTRVGSSLSLGNPWRQRERDVAEWQEEVLVEEEGV